LESVGKGTNDETIVIGKFSLEKVETNTTSVENDETRNILTSRLVDDSGKSLSEKGEYVSRAQEWSAVLAPTLRSTTIERCKVELHAVGVDGVGNIGALRSVEVGGLSRSNLTLAYFTTNSLGHCDSVVNVLNAAIRVGMFPSIA